MFSIAAFKSFSFTTRLLPALLVISLMNLPVALKAAPMCEQEIQDKMAGLDLKGFTPIKTITAVQYGNAGGGSSADSWESWTSFEQCQGDLVMHFEGDCMIRKTYTTGNCLVKGLHNY